MAKRRSLDDLVNEGPPLQTPADLPRRPAQADAARPPEVAADAAAQERPDAAAAASAPRAGRSGRPRRPRPEVTESQTSGWRELERKELRLRPGQLDELARLRRVLNRQRAGAGERITDNTLIRVAVDLLLDSAAQLAGTTEDELRNSVSNRVRKAAAS